MRPTKLQIAEAVDQMKLIKFFPSDASESLCVLLEKMVPTSEALAWLVDAMLNRVGEWHGPVELRGVLCQKARPMDGEEAFCSRGYYSVEAVERRSIAEAGGIKALPLPDLKQLMGGGK